MTGRTADLRSEGETRLNGPVVYPFMGPTPTTRPDRSLDTDPSPGAARLDALALGGAAAIVSAAGMLVLGVLGAVGVYMNGVRMMQEWHLFFEPTAVGTAAGMIEAAAFSFVFVAGLAWIYNELAR